MAIIDALAVAGSSVLGALLGYFGVKFCSGGAEGHRGRMPSLRFRLRQYTVHLHHWLFSSLTGVWLFLNREIFSLPIFLFLFGGAVGMTFQGTKYKDWKRIIFK
ncbi:MAG TPA: hypothetical protein VJC16_04185 [Candidatus Nanoarchaeia archaeon]|nr:hypothetical protein [Candidatus Nanoarchaeia archaeon]